MKPVRAKTLPLPPPTRAGGLLHDSPSPCGRGQGGGVSLKLCLLLTLLPLAGCQAPYSNDLVPPDPGWTPQGVNAANIRVMAAHPADLAAGQADRWRVAAPETAPVFRLWQDRVKPLPASEIDSSGAGGGTGPAAPSPASAPPPSGSN